MHANSSLVSRLAKPSIVWRGIVLFGLIFAAPFAEIKASLSEPALQLELENAAEEEAPLEDEAEAKEAKSIPEPSFAAAFAAGTGMLITLNYLRRRIRR